MPWKGEILFQTVTVYTRYPCKIIIQRKRAFSHGWLLAGTKKIGSILTGKQPEWTPQN